MPPADQVRAADPGPTSARRRGLPIPDNVRSQRATERRDVGLMCNSGLGHVGVQVPGTPPTVSISGASTRRSFQHELMDPLSRFIGVLVFLHPNHQPTHRAQLFIAVAIAQGDPTQLQPPPATVCLRQTAMTWTRMPEAAIDEDGHPRTPQQDVHPSTTVGPLRGLIHNKPQPSTMQRSPKSQLRLGPSLLRPVHYTRGHLGTRRRSRTRVAIPVHSSECDGMHRQSPLG